MSAIAVGIIVALATSIIQFLFLFPSHKAKELMNVKIKAYSEFIENVAAVKFQNRTESSLQALTASIVSITTFAEKDVIEKLYKFKQSGMVLDNPEAQTNFNNLLMAFRKSLQGRCKPKVSEHILMSLVFGK